VFNDKGYIYLTLLLAIAIMGAGLAGASTLYSFSETRAKEMELLRIGNTYRRAIGMYYEQTPGYVKKYPANLEALLKDNRYSTNKRYLRQIYRDPITGGSVWGTVEDGSGGIMGIYSMSDRQPIKTEKFSKADKKFEKSTKYEDWKFVYVPAVVITK